LALPGSAKATEPPAAALVATVTSVADCTAARGDLTTGKLVSRSFSISML